MKLTFKQVIEKVGIKNPSTLAFQRDKFAEFIPCENEGRHRRYNDESVEVLRIISSMYAEGKSYDEIRDKLEGRFGIPAEMVPAENNSSSTNQQNEFMDAIRKVFQQELNRRDELILELQEELQEIKQTLLKQDEKAEDRCRSAESRDRDILQQIEKIREESQQRNKPWWKRMIDRT